MAIAGGRGRDVAEDARTNSPSSGWAMEARLYAEDPGTGFLPSTGPLGICSLPQNILASTAGWEEDDVITPYYDPMIAKLIVQAPRRAKRPPRLAASLPARSSMAGENQCRLSCPCRG